MIGYSLEDLGMIAITTTSSIVDRAKLVSAFIIFGTINKPAAVRLCALAGLDEGQTEALIEETFD